MRFSRWFANIMLKGLVALLFRVDDSQMTKVPKTGPLIIVTNHINAFEIPVLHLRLQPRRVTGLAKAEAWKNPVFAWLYNLWEVIPIHRGRPDLTAIRRSIDVLCSNSILSIAPEGTRSHHGRLQKGHSGVVTLALRSKAPILPIVFYGGEALKHNVRRFRRTPFHIVVGEPFSLNNGQRATTHAERQELTDEIMYKLAALLPPEYRGEYATKEETPQ